MNKRIIGDGKLGPVTKHLMEEFQKVARDPDEGVLIK
jgi:hypothetical protein